MNQDIDAATRRFERSLHILMQHLGPHLIQRMPFGLTPGQLFMLYFVRQERRCSVSKLAEKMEVSPSAITVMLDRLENHGLVKRTRDQADRRVVVVELTEAGEQRLDQVLQARRRIVRHCLSHVGSGELEPFLRTLEALASTAQAMDLQALVNCVTRSDAASETGESGGPPGGECCI
ncbi:MAG: MarR family transcriptional regulator [Alicyclobacillus sp.]|nr:MarR family transcriptional regulator [Alicyclobacillus sp.]